MTEPPPHIDVLTPPGRGAVAVISCLGDIAILDGTDSAAPLCRARDGSPFRGRPVDRITFARWGTEHPEDVVVCRTAENEFEVHCHGGRAAVERIRDELMAATGIRQSAGPGRESGGETARLLAAAWDAVSRATTLRTADLLLNQAAEAWPAVLGNAQGADAHRSREWMARGLEWAEFGRHLTEPWTVAIVGRPNAGKSSLMNTLAGFQRSIVNATPGTTRDAVTLDVAFDGWPVRLIDTAGLRESADELESAGIERARDVIATADLVVQVFDSTEGAVERMPGAIVVANKIDLALNASWPAEFVPVSALTGAGVDELAARIVAELIPESPPEGMAIPVCQEQVEWLAASVTKGRWHATGRKRPG